MKLFPMTADINSEGHLTIGDCDTIELVNKYGTPLYVIDEKAFKYKSNEYINSLKKRYQDFLVLYAAKAFACTSVFKIADQIGLGLDVVSGGELYFALKTNVNKKNIYFHGNNKSLEEIDLAISSDIGKIICDNFYELELVQNIAEKRNKNIDILIRLTPGIECHTHEYIKTGHLDSKFGFDLEDYDDVLNFIKTKGKNLLLKGIHAHIGSQIFELKPFADTIDILLEQFKYTKEKHKIELTEINIGGGIGISYTKEDDPITIDKWAEITTSTIKEKCKTLNLKLPKLICEPGRSLIGPSGITLYKAGSTKQVPNGRKFIAVDGGMADNPRPITYQAKYTAVLANKMNSSENMELVTIAGRYCETGDLLIKDILLPEIKAGDIIAVLNTGAYNYSMSSNYNMVPRPACVLVNEGTSEIIIERETYSDLIKSHKTPKRFM
ncbi:MAG: diaminopimelate decarboxylase [Candidatus Melainabacteria bacterium]|nr:diaminopimelate decarboxylase [Candidatus Melainabacteria bacterium]